MKAAVASSTHTPSPAQSWMALALVALLSALVWYELQPPAAQPASRPATEFSAERAMVHLAAFARNPHPIGSTEHARVRNYLVQQLRLLGLELQVQRATGFFLEPWWGPPYQIATVENIVARIPGTAGGKAVMLVSHYDSVATGPGAADDGAGVAAILETARALKSGPRLRNDVILLITDGEEIELLGAAAFVDEHPWARDVGVVLNFEAQGSSGASLMYQTSTPNGRLIAEFAKAAPNPVTSSLMDEVARRDTSSDSDLSVFRRAGMAGLNFAFIGDQPRYHTVHDDIDHLDRRSLQHHGDNALALARHFGNLDLGSLNEDRDAIFFNVFGTVLHYSQRWVWPLHAAAMMLLAGALAAGWRMYRFTVKGILLGAGLWLLAAAIAIGLAQLGWIVLDKAHMIAALPYGDSYNGELYGAGLTALALAIVLLAYVLARRLAPADSAAGALLCFSLLATAATVLAPGGSYLFVWPLVFAAAGLLLRFVSSGQAAFCVSWAAPVLATFLLFGPTVYLLLQFLSDNLLLVTVPAVVQTAVLIPLIYVLQGRTKWLAPGALLSLSVMCMVLGVCRRHFDGAHPKADNLFYLANFDSGKAVWASCGTGLDAYTAQALAGATRRALAEYGPFRSACFAKDGIMPELLPPAVVVQADRASESRRELIVLVTSPRKAQTIWIKLRNIKVQAASVNGKKLTSGAAFQRANDWNLIYWNVPEGGLTLSLQLPPGPLEMTVFDVSNELPQLPGGMPLRPRPADLMPSPAFVFDHSTLLGKSFRY